MNQDRQSPADRRSAALRTALQRSPWQMWAVFAGIAVVLSVAGYLYFSDQFRRDRDAKLAELGAIADLKLQQLVAWRDQHASNLRIVSTSVPLASRFALFARSPRDPALLAEMDGWLKTYLGQRNYSDGLFLDPGGRTLIKEGPGPVAIGANAPSLIARAASTRAPAVSDLHLGPGGKAEMDFCAPLFSPGGKKGLLGFVYFRQDAETFLFPLLQSWPIPSPTAELLLARREGEEVVFLNPLRHRESPPLGLRLSVSQTSLLAVQAFLDPHAVLDGVDYRGVPVIGIFRTVPNTGWMMIAKVDRGEVLGPLWKQGGMAFTLVLLLILVAGGAVSLLWNLRQADLYRRVHEGEERYREIVWNMQDAYFRAGPDGRLVMVSPSAARMYGFDRPEQMAGLPAESLYRHPEQRREMLALLEKAGKVTDFVGEGVRKDGSPFWVSINIQALRDGTGRFTGTEGFVRDISERRRSIEALEESERRFRSLIESMAESVAIYRPLQGEEDFIITEFNPAAQRTEKVRREDVVGHRLTEVFPGVRDFGLLEVLSRVARTGKAESFPLGFYKDKRISGWRDNYVYRLPSGEVAAVYWDRTAEKQAEEKIRLLSERLEMAARAGAVGIWDLDVAGNRLVWDDSMYRLYGITSDRFGGAYESWAATLHPGDKDRMQREYEQALSGEKDYDTEFCVVWPDDGSVHHIKAMATVTRDSAGRPLRMVGTNWDVTARRLAEAALATEKERLAVTLRSIGDGVIACDLEQKVVVLNKVAEDLTGWKAEEALGRPLSEVFRIVNAITRETCANPVDKVIASGHVVGLANHTLLLARDGSEFSIADSGSPIRDHESRIIGAVLVFRDVTGQEKVEEELARAQKLESLAVLAGGIAHDFNNLLTGILGNISLSRLDAPEGTKVAARLEEAERAGLRARALTQQLLTFAHGGSPVKSRADLGALLDETARFATRGSTVACRFSLAPGLFADIDEGQIGQVIHNLVLNAVQAMPGGGTISLETEAVELQAGNPFGLGAGNYARVSVSDSGAGIPPHLLPRIFDPFFTTKEKGKGLGLAICHSVVRNHDGHIEVSCPPGMGATFHVYLPACGKEGTGRKERKPREKRMETGRGERILVMDDEEMVRELAVEMLATLGYGAVGTTDGAAALDLYREAKEKGSPFEVVIMDLTIPAGMGGKETIARLRQLDPAVKAVVSSGYSNDPIMANFADYGFAAVLTKPYRVGDLKEILEKVLKR